MPKQLESGLWLETTTYCTTEGHIDSTNTSFLDNLLTVTHGIITNGKLIIAGDDGFDLDEIVIGDAANYVIVNSTGVGLRGNATVYDDLFTVVASGKMPEANYPTWTAFTTNTGAYQFKVNDYIDLATVEIKHNWKEGSTIEFHVHWATTGVDVADKYIQWRIYYFIAQDGVAFPDDSYIEAEHRIPANTPTRTSYRTTIGSVAMTGFRVGTQVKTRLKRVAALSGNPPTLDPFAGMVGIHYEIDAFGSKTMYAK